METVRVCYRGVVALFHRESGDQVSLVVASRETMSVFYKLKIDVTTELLVSWPKEDSFAKPTMTDFIEKRMASMKISEKKSEKEEEVCLQEVSA